MTADNLPARRTSYALAVIPPAATRPEPVHNRLSEDYLLLAFIGGVLTSSAPGPTCGRSPPAWASGPGSSPPSESTTAGVNTERDRLL
ncbi:hypothetical protein [Micromonospora wenchangensis]|uniref:hypothetical protein n=1 Tax=Micromonospora wenchangensis TaxID=1185415 RepID=UPI00382F61A8